MIEIKITGDTPLAALADMAAFATYIQDNPLIQAAADLHNAEEYKSEVKTKSVTRDGFAPTAPAAVAPFIPAAAPPAPVAPAPIAPPAPIAYTAPAAPPPAVPIAAAPAYTAEQLAHAGADFVMRNPARAGEAQQLLARFGVQAVTDLPKERYGEFATALRGLGAQV